MRSNFIRVWSGFWSKMGSQLFYPQETGKIIDHLYAIRDQDMNLFLYTDGKSMLCIDAGYINNHALKREFQRVGIDPGSVTHLFLTHVDLDHAGAIDQDSQTHWFDQAQVFVGKNEQCMIDGNTPRSFIFQNPVEISRKYLPLNDGEIITVGDLAVQAIATPGHTPGHMAYLINGEILCTGDALVLKDGKVEPFYRTWNMDNVMVEQSIRKLAALDHISVLCTGHTRCSFSFKSAICQ